MSVHSKVFRSSQSGATLSIVYDGPRFDTRGPSEVDRAIKRVLEAHPPVAFAGGQGEVITAEELSRVLDQAVQQAQDDRAQQREQRLAEQRELGWLKLEEALSGEGAAQVIEEGRWAGFTQGEAAAWCWNLFQYEPHGFIMPGFQVRHEAMKKLLAGGLPEVFGYPERARELAGEGLTPRTFRLRKEATNALLFLQEDVRYGNE